MRESCTGFCELRFCSRKDYIIQMETVVHQFADCFTTEQLFRTPIKEKINTAHMNPEVIRLREKHAVR